MFAIPPFGASSNIAFWRANGKPPVELVVDDLIKDLKEGGKYGQVNVSLAYFSKIACRAKASEYAGKKLPDGKSYGVERLASEIYAHTIAYYAASILPIAGIKLVTCLSDRAINNGLNYIISHSNPIDLGGNSTTRVLIYTALWNLL